MKNNQTVMKIACVMFICLVCYMTFSLSKKDVANNREDIIIWQDSAVEAAMRNIMFIHDEANISISDAAAWNYSTTVILEGEDIKSLEDLRYFPGIINLIIKDTSISDLSPLGSMKELRDLEIIGGQVSDLEVLSNLEYLYSLSLRDIPVQSVESLSEIKQLSFLEIDGLPVIDLLGIWENKKLYSLILKNISLEKIPSNELVNLERFYIIDSEISDLSGLSDMVSLHELEIVNCQVGELPPLTEQLKKLKLERTNIKNLTQLPSSITRLYLSGNEILSYNSLLEIKDLNEVEIYNMDLSELDEWAWISNLKKLSLVNCNLQDIDVFECGTKLTTLILEGNKIQSIKDIKGVTDLRYLNISKNKLKNLEGIAHLSNLTTLDLSENQVQSMQGIESVDSLFRLDLSRNNLTSLNGLEKHSSMKILNLSNNPLTDIYALKNLYLLEEIILSGIELQNVNLSDVIISENLNKLILSDCKLKDISMLKFFTNISVLDISNNEITDYQVVGELPELIDLNISNNPIVSFDPLNNCTKLNTLNISGIDLNKVEGLEALQETTLLKLTAQNCMLQDFSPFIETLFRVNLLDVSNNQINNLNDLIDSKWSSAFSIDVTENLIDENYMKQIDGYKMEEGVYRVRELYAVKFKINGESEFY